MASPNMRLSQNEARTNVPSDLKANFKQGQSMANARKNPMQSNSKQTQNT